MFTLKIETDNAAFDHRAASECARILRAVAKRICDGELDGKVRDVNGNTVGEFHLTGE